MLNHNIYILLNLIRFMKIIALSLSGIFIKSDAWKKAHHLWFEESSRKLQDPSLLSWINKENYFPGVDLAMKRLYPGLLDDERTIKARDLYFHSVLDYIKLNKSIINKQVVDYFKTLKTDYKLALITTNKLDSLNQILKLTNLNNFFDIIESSKPNEKDDKILVFQRFIKKHGNPLIYIGGDRKDSYDFCKKNNIPCLFANFENSPELNDVESVYNLEELKRKLSKLK